MADDNDYVFDKDALHEWWRSLDENRGRRAELRRCHTLGEVQSTHAFERSARFRLLDAGVHGNDEQLATVAGLLAHIREHAPAQTSFAKQMATPDSEGGRPPVSEMRFRRLLRTKDRARLYKPLRRVLPILGTPPRANIFAVAQDVIRWGPWKRCQWAEGYYAVLLKSEKPIREVNSREETWQVWWEELQQQERRGERATLRRCSTLNAVMLTTGYHRLLHYLQGAGVYETNSRWQHAAVAGLLAHVEENDERHSFATQMALPNRAVGSEDGEEGSNEPEEQGSPQGSAPLSGLRFRRLVQTSDRAVLFRKLIRTLRLLGGRAHVADLADAMFFWNDNRRRDWSLAYYQHAPSDEP